MLLSHSFIHTQLIFSRHRSKCHCVYNIKTLRIVLVARYLIYTLWVLVRAYDRVTRLAREMYGRQFYSRLEYRRATSNANGERRFPRRDHGSLAKRVDRMRRGGRVGAAEAIILYRIICPLHWIMPSWRQSLTCLYASSLLRWTLRLTHVWLKARIVM